ncbi:hypothetical protein HK104_007321, partial [Borealophlyctis nickersoniae]
MSVQWPYFSYALLSLTILLLTLYRTFTIEHFYTHPWDDLDAPSIKDLAWLWNIESIGGFGGVAAVVLAGWIFGERRLGVSNVGEREGLLNAQEGVVARLGGVVGHQSDLPPLCEDDRTQRKKFSIAVAMTVLAIFNIAIALVELGTSTLG